MDIIVTHHNADFDALASVVAAQKMHPQASIIMPDLQERGVREFLRLSAGTVKLYSERDFAPQTVQKLIIVDTRQASRIGQASLCLENQGIEVLVYDHHPRAKGDIKATRDVYAKTGATVTILVEQINQRNLSLTPLEATIFCLGIYEDTGSLTFPTTTKRDVDAVSFLFSQGANLDVLRSSLNRELSEAEAQTLAALLGRVKRYEIAGSAVGIVAVRPQEATQDIGWIIHKLLEIENVRVLFALIPQGQRTLVMARSRGPHLVDVNRVMKAFGGGGHASAAAAMIPAETAASIETRLLKELKRQIRATVLARHIMRQPRHFIRPGHTMQHAQDLMASLQLAALAIIEKGRLVGVISRPAVEQVIKRGYAHAPVKGYMAVKWLSITPTTGFAEIRRLVTQNNAVLLPVVQRDKLVGIINRADVLEAEQRQAGRSAAARQPRPRQQQQTVKLMEKCHSPETMALLRLLGRHAQTQQIQAYVVGGFVRDLLLKRRNLDIDVVVERDGIMFARKIAPLLRARCVEHPRFKTAKLELPDGLVIDIATSRSEIYPHPAALPVVAADTIRRDLGRRDFTINTLALCLNPRRFGELLDYFSAAADLRQGCIRVLHDLSFVEDPTRILRAVRFEQRFGFTIDPHTEHLIRAAVDLDMFERLHKFRIAEELKLLLEEPHPLKNIRRMAQLHELEFIHPDIRWNEQLSALLEAAEESLGWYKLTFPERPLERWLVYVLALMDRVGREQSKQMFRHLGLKKNARQCLEWGKTRVPGLVRQLRRVLDLSPSRMYNLLSGIPHEALLYAMAKLPGLAQKEIIITFLTKYDRIKLDIDGHDLTRMSLRRGRALKKVLEHTREALLDGRVHSRQEQLDFARKII